MGLRYNVSGASGNANGITAGNTVNGNAIFIGQNFRKLRDLVALASFTAATSTITATGKWQGSNDASTWVDLTPANNAANVTFATGTTTIKTASFDAPPGVYGWKYARFVFVIGVVTGGASDLYSIAYNYRQLSGAESVGSAA